MLFIVSTFIQIGGDEKRPALWYVMGICHHRDDSAYDGQLLCCQGGAVITSRSMCLFENQVSVKATVSTSCM